LIEAKEDPKAYMARVFAARLGCGICKGRVRETPTGDPFSKGPYVGRYWCTDCWTLYWDEHPDHLADDESRKYVRREATIIKLKRGSQVLFEQGDDRVFRTAKGTIVFDFRTSKELAPNEFDSARMAVLLQALKAIESAELKEPQRVAS